MWGKGHDISLVEVVDVYICMYVLVMTTVIYNSPHSLSLSLSVISALSMQIGLNT